MVALAEEARELVVVSAHAEEGRDLVTDELDVRLRLGDNINKAILGGSDVSDYAEEIGLSVASANSYARVSKQFGKPFRKRLSETGVATAYSTLRDLPEECTQQEFIQLLKDARKNGRKSVTRDDVLRSIGKTAYDHRSRELKSKDPEYVADIYDALPPEKQAEVVNRSKYMQKTLNTEEVKDSEHVADIFDALPPEKQAEVVNRSKNMQKVVHTEESKFTRSVLNDGEASLANDPVGQKFAERGRELDLVSVLSRQKAAIKSGSDDLASVLSSISTVTPEVCGMVETLLVEVQKAQSVWEMELSLLREKIDGNGSSLDAELSKIQESGM